MSDRALVHGEELLDRTAVGLRTGTQRPWRFYRAYGCGRVVGCRNLLVFRADTRPRPGNDRDLASQIFHSSLQ